MFNKVFMRFLLYLYTTLSTQFWVKQHQSEAVPLDLKEPIHLVAEPKLVKDYDASLMDDLGKISSDLISTYKERVCVNPLLQ